MIWHTGWRKSQCLVGAAAALKRVITVRRAANMSKCSTWHLAPPRADDATKLCSNIKSRLFPSRPPARYSAARHTTNLLFARFPIQVNCKCVCTVSVRPSICHILCIIADVVALFQFDKLSKTDPVSAYPYRGTVSPRVTLHIN